MHKFGLVLGLSLCLLACNEKEMEESIEETKVSLGKEQGAFGTNVSRPDWLPKSLSLPGELTIQVTAYEPDLGEGMVHGSISNVPVGNIIDAQSAMLEKAGYTIVAGPPSDGVSGTHADGSYVTVQAAGSSANQITYRMQYFAKHSDDAINAQAKANAYAGNGELAVEVGDETFNLQGSCHVQGRGVEFESADSASSLSASAYGATPSLRGTLVIQSDSTVRTFGLASLGPAGEVPVVSVTATGFTYHGAIVDFATMSTSPGSMTMHCDPI